MSKFSKFLHDRWNVSTGDGMSIPSRYQTPGAIPNVGGPHLPSPNVPTNAMSWGDVGGGIKNVGEWVLKNPDSILALASLYQGYQDNKRANQLQDKAIASSEQRMKLGHDAAQQLMGLQRPDLSDVYTDPGNPYARRIRSVGRGA